MRHRDGMNRNKYKQVEISRDGVIEMSQEINFQ